MKMVAPLEVGICCTALEPLIRFYGHLIGCELINIIDVPAANAEKAALSWGPYRVARLQTPSGERLKFLQPSLTPRQDGPDRWILDRRNTTYLTFIVDDLGSMIERLHSLGAEITTGPRPVEIRAGVRLCFARDPEGNILEFVEYDDVTSYREPS
ncbi:MAG TPA: VOC family protein [Steroidobacteraceae bacterium]|nr:VOC family protein [Steroidobacteraceae bacterium]